jgi:hypothetical protein
MDIYNSIHIVESRLNHVECKYSQVFKEDDFTKVYGLLSELCLETDAVKEWVSIFMKCDSSTLKVISNILAEQLSSDHNDNVTSDFQSLKKIVDAVINLKK